MLQSILERQKAFFQSGRTKSLDFRLGQLQQLRDGIKKYESAILSALHEDLGKSAFEAYTSEVGLVLESINYTMKHLKQWMKVKKVSVPLHQIGSKSFYQYEPFGTVAIIAPFNYPFQLTVEPMIGAIAAGNTVVLKPSSETPHVEQVIIDLIKEVFSDGYVNVVTGGREVTTELIHSQVDYIFFTGSVKVGKIIMEAASKQLIPVTLELGGKSPAIVDEHANIDKAAKRIVWGKYYNAGQTCIAPDYVYVHESIKDELVEKMKYYIQQFYGEAVQESPDYGRIVSERHYSRLKDMIPEDHVIGGHTHDDTLYIEPTIVDEVTWEHGLMKEEIFGPILPVLTFETLREVITAIHARPKPLALYLFTENKHVERRILEETSSGGVAINDTLTQVASTKLPFGGVGESGMGVYHGKFSFETFSHKKSVVKKSTKFDLNLIYPPYKNKLKFVKKFLK